MAEADPKKSDISLKEKLYLSFSEEHYEYEREKLDHLEKGSLDYSIQHIICGIYKYYNYETKSLNYRPRYIRHKYFKEIKEYFKNEEIIVRKINRNQLQFIIEQEINQDDIVVYFDEDERRMFAEEAWNNFLQNG